MKFCGIAGHNPGTNRLVFFDRIVKFISRNISRYDYGRRTDSFKDR